MAGLTWRVLKLDGDVVFQVDNQRMEHRRAEVDTQLVGKGRRCIQLVLHHRLGRVDMATLGDFVSDVAHFKDGRAALAFGDEGAEPLDAQENAVGSQFAQRPVDGHAAQAEAGDQFVLRGDAMARRPLAAGDAGEDLLLDHGIMRWSSAGTLADVSHFVAYPKSSGPAGIGLRSIDFL